MDILNNDYPIFIGDNTSEEISFAKDKSVDKLELGKAKIYFHKNEKEKVWLKVLDEIDEKAYNLNSSSIR